MRKEYKIHIASILSLLLFLPFFQLYYLKEIEMVGHLYKIGQLISIAVLSLIILLLILYRKIKIDIMNKVLLLFFLELFLVTIINKGNNYSLLIYFIPIISFSVLLSNIERKTLIVILKSLTSIFFIILILNLLSVILFPDGLYSGFQVDEKYFFVGHNNAQIRWLFPGLVIAGLSDILQFDKFKSKTYIYAILLLLTVTLTWSNISMIAAGIIVLFLLIFKETKFEKIFNAKTMIMIPIIIFLILIVFGGFNKGIGFIASLFGKDATLTGRTEIWKIGVNVIKNNFWFGNGYGKTINNFLNWRDSIEINSFHNLFLDLIFRGGIVHLALFLIFIFLILRKVNSKSNILSRFINVTFIAYYIMWVGLPFINFDSWLMFPLFVLCAKCSEEYLKEDVYEE